MSFSEPYTQSRPDFTTARISPQSELIDALRRPIAGADWGLWKTTILGVASFGLLPLLIWPSQFREFTTAEAHQLSALANWARHGRASDRVSNRLARVARSVEASAFFGLLPMLFALYVATLFVIQFSHQSFDLNALLDLTYRASPHHHLIDDVGPIRTGAWPGWSLHFVWCMALSVGYLLHWAQVRMHVAAMRRYFRMFHRTLSDDVLLPVQSVWRSAGIWPLGIVAGVLLIRMGAWWGIPMLLAAGAQRRYMWQTSRLMRGALAARAGGAAPLATVAPTSANLVGICPMRGCGAQLPTRARFCPRCGVRVGPADVG